MELIVFDLDGTLLDRGSVVSEHTGETLKKLRQRGIAYTVATGRTLHAARDLLQGHGFALPQIYKNGVMIWQPEEAQYSHCSLLTDEEIRSVVEAFNSAQVTPFIFTLEPENHHVVYHGPLRNDGERRLTTMFAKDRGLALLPIEQMPPKSDISNISALGTADAIASVQALVDTQAHLVAYSGVALDKDWHWMDVHHSAASKGSAIEQLKQDLGFSRVICFGDSDNDLSMFEMADECYAPANAKEQVLSVATAVIGHHDEDGISRFLRERFEL
ncbi:MAG: Cof subfamily protein (haloacid dehalogenase superfamily) [Halioglobus sp.]|jgi:Cof subfamily protein (haloacid dehalogenase superfamily)